MHKENRTFERKSPVFGTMRKILRPIGSGKYVCTATMNGAEQTIGIKDGNYINDLLTAGYNEI